jgi:hypothetical protein
MKEKSSMKVYFIEYYNNALKIWGEITLIADSEEEAIQSFLSMNEDGQERSITLIKEQED